MRPLSIMFMDVRGFTPISEMLTPEDLVISSTRCSRRSPTPSRTRRARSTKYIGDSIMAFWNAPL
ncbi:MAG: hypothetical protein QNJ43_15290 [Breoghania sp.]|nr:hypothetical protein [Breoghania sp.]